MPDGKENTRLIWIDYAKLIGIWTVILLHINVTDTRFSHWTLSFMLPIFFILSGFVDKGQSSISDILKKSAKSLLIPYFWFYIISYAWWLVVTFRRHPELYSHDLMVGFVKPIIGLLLGEGSHTPISTMVNVPLWFLPVLFFSRMIFNLFLSFDRNKYYGLIAINILSFIIIYLRNNYFGINLYWGIDSAIMAIPFYTFGFFLKRFIDKIDPNIISRIVLCITLLAISIPLTQWNGIMDMNTCDYGKSLSVYYIDSIVSTLGIILFARLFSNINSRFLIYLGKNTLILFSFHLIMTGWVKKIYELILGTSFSSYHAFTPLEAMIISAVTIVISVIPAYIINKYFPFMLGKIKTNPSTSSK